MINKSLTINNIDKLPTVVAKVMPLLSDYKTFCLIGDLGAGKTTFVKCLMKELSVAEEVDSPTYSIINEYESDLGPIAHIDLYRLNSEDEMMDIGIQDYIDNYICFIEWPQLAESLLDDAIIIRIKRGEGEVRTYDIMDYQSM